MAAEGYTTDTNLHVGVALPLHHATHKVVFGNQVLGLHQMDSQHSLQADSGCGCFWRMCIKVLSAAFSLYYLSSKLWIGGGVLWSCWLRFSQPTGS